jgi:ribulose-phosphate 3-epimerase
MSVLIAPSMLSANFANLENDIKTVNKSDADLFHLDIMDGVFVPNISYGFPVVEAIAKKASKPLDAHLMIVNPEKYITRFRFKCYITTRCILFSKCRNLLNSIFIM